jgi:hypothetical protein
MTSSDYADGMLEGMRDHEVKQAHADRQLGHLRTGAVGPEACPRSILSLYQDLEPASADDSRCASSSRSGRFAQWHRRPRCASLSRAAIGIALSRGGRDGTHSCAALSERHCFVSYTRSPPIVSIIESARIWSSGSGNTLASSTSSCRARPKPEAGIRVHCQIHVAPGAGRRLTVLAASAVTSTAATKPIRAAADQ